jgi:protein-tyrosine phosphatase
MSRIMPFFSALVKITLDKSRNGHYFHAIVPICRIPAFRRPVWPFGLDSRAFASPATRRETLSNFGEFFYAMHMNRIDVHNHFIPNLDDGCQSLDESLECLRTMSAAGYSRSFCTPHCAANDFTHLSTDEVAAHVNTLQGQVNAAGISIALKPGGELRLTPHLAELFADRSIPTFAHAGKYVLTDLWEYDWPAWATRAVEWLQKRGLTVILAHPERMPVLRKSPAYIDELAKLGLLFQGNLGPIGGGDSADIVALSRRYLQENRYFLVGTDGHRPSHMAVRMNGLRVIEELVGAEKLQELTVTNPGRLWS